MNKLIERMARAAYEENRRAAKATSGVHGTDHWPDFNPDDPFFSDLLAGMGVALSVAATEHTELLRKIDEAVSAYAAGAGAANAGDPDAVIGEVARILEGHEPMDDGEIRVGDVWDYHEGDGPTAHTVVAVSVYAVSVQWDVDGQITTMPRDYFLRTRHRVSRKEN